MYQGKIMENEPTKPQSSKIPNNEILAACLDLEPLFLSSNELRGVFRFEYPKDLFLDSLG
jgi:hypothetical protein